VQGFTVKFTTSIPILAGIAWLSGRTSLAAGEERPPFEKLFDLNSEKVFGGKAKLEGDRVTIEFTKSGQFSRGFEGTGMLKLEDIKGLNRDIIDKAGQREGKPAVASNGEQGEWQSRFELSGDVSLSFKITVRPPQRSSQFVVWLNRGSKGALQSSFFQSAALVSGGKVKKTVASKEIQGTPDKWFDPRTSFYADLSVKEKAFTVKAAKQPKEDKDKLEMKESTVLDDIGDANSGRIVFSFKKLGFVLSNVKVSGKIDLEWVKKQLQELEDKGDLVLKEAPASVQPPTRKSLEKAEDEKAKRRKEAEVDL